MMTTTTTSSSTNISSTLTTKQNGASTTNTKRKERRLLPVVLLPRAAEETTNVQKATQVTDNSEAETNVVQKAIQVKDDCTINTSTDTNSTSQSSGTKPSQHDHVKAERVTIKNNSKFCCLSRIPIYFCRYCNHPKFGGVIWIAIVFTMLGLLVMLFSGLLWGSSSTISTSRQGTTGDHSENSGIGTSTVLPTLSNNATTTTTTSSNNHNNSTTIDTMIDDEEMIDPDHTTIPQSNKPQESTTNTTSTSSNTFTDNDTTYNNNRLPSIDVFDEDLEHLQIVTLGNSHHNNSSSSTSQHLRYRHRDETTNKNETR